MRVMTVLMTSKMPVVSRPAEVPTTPMGLKTVVE
jgi:hypothetical protein